MLPPNSSASFFASGSPSPVPLHRFWIGLSNCTNSWKMRSWSSGRDADTRVRHGEDHGVVSGSLSSRAHPHLAALGELERVGDEVAQDLRQLGLVGEQRWDARGLLEDQADGVVA